MPQGCSRSRRGSWCFLPSGTVLSPPGGPLVPAVPAGRVVPVLAAALAALDVDRREVAPSQHPQGLAEAERQAVALADEAWRRCESTRTVLLPRHRYSYQAFDSAAGRDLRKCRAHLHLSKAPAAAAFSTSARQLQEPSPGLAVPLRHFVHLLGCCPKRPCPPQNALPRRQVQTLVLSIPWDVGEEGAASPPPPAEAAGIGPAPPAPICPAARSTRA